MDEDKRTRYERVIIVTPDHGMKRRAFIGNLVACVAVVIVLVLCFVLPK